MPELPPELLEAILAEPDADAPRLVAADWYDDAGDSDRGEFIRVQCQMAEFRRRKIRNPERVATAQREAQLIQANQARWLESVMDLVRAKRLTVEFRRGWIGALRADERISQAEMPNLAIDPLIESVQVRLGNCDPSIVLAQAGTLRNLRDLRLWFPQTDLSREQIEPLVKLLRMRRLNLQGGQYGTSLMIAHRTWLTRQWKAAQTELPTDDRDTSLRAQLGTALQSTQSGFDVLVMKRIPRQDIVKASQLPGLRVVELHRGLLSVPVGLLRVPKLRSLQVEVASNWIRGLSALTNTHELILNLPQAESGTTLAEVIQPMTQLRSLIIRGKLNRPDPLLTVLPTLTQLRVLHLPDMKRHDLSPLEGTTLPSLIELSMPAKLDRIERIVTESMPRLRLIEISSRAQLFNQTIPARPDLLIDARNFIASHLETSFARTETLADGTHLRLPAWMQRIEPAAAPHAVNREEITPLGAWHEFEEEVPIEYPEMLKTGGTRIWLERLDRPRGSISAREWLTGPPTPLLTTRWSSFISIESTSRAEVRAIRWTAGWLSGFRAIWTTKTHIYRLLTEWSTAREMPWLAILTAMTAQLRLPDEKASP